MFWAQLNLPLPTRVSRPLLSLSQSKGWSTRPSRPTGFPELLAVSAMTRLCSEVLTAPSLIPAPLSPSRTSTRMVSGRVLSVFPLMATASSEATPPFSTPVPPSSSPLLLKPGPSTPRSPDRRVTVGEFHHPMHQHCHCLVDVWWLSFQHQTHRLVVLPS